MAVRNDKAVIWQLERINAVIWQLETIKLLYGS